MRTPNNPNTVLNRVDLPAPLGPITVVMAPRRMAALTSELADALSAASSDVKATLVVSSVESISAYVLPSRLAALRERIDPAFLPRPLCLVDELPRNATGKLPRGALDELAGISV